VVAGISVDDWPEFVQSYSISGANFIKKNSSLKKRPSKVDRLSVASLSTLL
jgi:hypothetical protein